MINYETILSSYDDKLTLMQWLKKVEAALKDASATGFHVNKRGNATITFSIDFANGETLESEPLILQQGESVESGEIRNGHLFLTLTNGDELDCGSLFNGEVPSLNVRSLEVSGGLLLGDDANAAIGGDLVVHGLTELENIKAYGDVETESLTAAGDKINAKKPVVEVMNGYSYRTGSQGSNVTLSYLGACKNGNKVTFVWAGTFSSGESGIAAYASVIVCGVNVPSSVCNLLFPIWSDVISLNRTFIYGDGVKKDIEAYVHKYSGNNGINLELSNDGTAIGSGKTLNFRYEATFLLSENLAA